MVQRSVAADGVKWISDLICQKTSRSLSNGLLIGAVIFLVIIPSLRSVRLDYLWAQIDTRTQAKQWIEDSIPEGSKIRSQWYGPPLSTKEDIEPDSEKTYQLQVLYPFSMAPGIYDLGHYRQEGYQYLVLSSFIYHLKMTDSAAEARREDFYHKVESETELLADFSPACSSEEISYFFEQMWGSINSLFDLCRPGPTIKIYRIN